jgi:apyrase/ectonucleoside triphosphate diphosphohydrolase 5/6
VELTGTGDYRQCLQLQLKLFERTTCTQSSCSFNGAYQPRLPGVGFKGFSYLYDRTAAIGLLDNKLMQVGSQDMSRADIDAAGETLCALDKQQTSARFSSHGDASKSANFCGDVAYISALLTALGFDPSAKLTMTNKIKDVELVWTLGAMLAKSAELSSSTSALPGLSIQTWLTCGLVLTAGAIYYFVRSYHGYSLVSLGDTGDFSKST